MSIKILNHASFVSFGFLIGLAFACFGSGDFATGCIELLWALINVPFMLSQLEADALSKGEQG